jgi:orotate phosphoribosyltransferase
MFRNENIRRQTMKNRAIAKELLSIGAVFLRPNEPFTWASGIKSPVYCDNRLILTSPEVRNIVEEALAKAIKEQYPDCQVLMGTSTAGIAHAAIVGHILGLPMGYVRAKAKDHGRTNRIEGKLLPGQKVVVVEDLISTGGSSMDTVEALETAGAQVLGILSIFNYGIRTLPVRTISLCDLETLAQVAVEEGYIEEKEMKEVLEWKSEI